MTPAQHTQTLADYRNILPAEPEGAQRLTDLEIKASFTEDLLEQLDQVVVRQQKQIDQLVQAVLALQQASADGPPSVTSNSRNLADDLPPHF